MVMFILIQLKTQHIQSIVRERKGILGEILDILPVMRRIPALNSLMTRTKKEFLQYFHFNLIGYAFDNDNVLQAFINQINKLSSMDLDQTLQKKGIG